jgi:uncharacterized membrane protein
MKRSRYLVGLLLLSNVGCSGMNNTESGALGGGLIGGGIGALAGAACGRPLAGAAIGGAVGAGTGALIGHDEDKREDRAKQVAAAYAAQMMTLTDVVKMTQDHVSDDLIINQMNSTYSNFNLRPDEITYLKQQGVSDRVIMAMQMRRYPPPGYVYRGVAPAGVVVVEPAPPPVAVGVGFGWGYHRHW